MTEESGKDKGGKTGHSMYLGSTEKGSLSVNTMDWNYVRHKWIH